MSRHRLRPRLGASALLQAVLFVAAVVAWDGWQKPEAPASTPQRPKPPRPTPPRSDLEVKVVRVAKRAPRPASDAPERAKSLSPSKSVPARDSGRRPLPSSPSSPQPDRSAPAPHPRHARSTLSAARTALSAKPVRRSVPSPKSAPVRRAKRTTAKRSTASASAPLQRDDVEGVPLRVLVPRSAGALSSHLAASGGCLVVSRLEGRRAEVVGVFAVVGGTARLVSRAPCSGVPRILADSRTLEALGDPVGQVRRRLGARAPMRLVVQLILTPDLEGAAKRASRRALGVAAPRQMAERARARGYAIRCLARPDGGIECR